MLSPIETIALSKAIKDTAAKEARPLLVEGHHDVDFTVRVRGPMLVAPPSPTTVKESVPPAYLVGLLLQQLPPSRRKHVESFVASHLSLWREGDNEAPPVEPSAAEAAERMLALGRRERAGTKNGNVTAPLTVELLSRALAA